LFKINISEEGRFSELLIYYLALIHNAFPSIRKSIALTFIFIQLSNN